MFNDLGFKKHKLRLLNKFQENSACRRLKNLHSYLRVFPRAESQNRQWGHRHTVGDADLNEALSSCPLLTYLFLSWQFCLACCVLFRSSKWSHRRFTGTTNKIIENVSLVKQPLLEKDDFSGHGDLLLPWNTFMGHPSVSLHTSHTHCHIRRILKRRRYKRGIRNLTFTVVENLAFSINLTH